MKPRDKNPRLATRMPHPSFVFPSSLLALSETVQHLHRPHLAPNLLTTAVVVPLSHEAQPDNLVLRAQPITSRLVARLQSTQPTTVKTTDKQFGVWTLIALGCPGRPRSSASNSTSIRWRQDGISDPESPKQPAACLPTSRCLGWEPTTFDPALSLESRGAFNIAANYPAKTGGRR